MNNFLEKQRESKERDPEIKIIKGIEAPEENKKNPFYDKY